VPERNPTVNAINRNSLIDLSMLGGVITLVVIALNAKQSIELRLDRLEQAQTVANEQRWTTNDMSNWVKDTVILNPGWRTVDPATRAVIESNGDRP
jgi:hypothetical protein